MDASIAPRTLLTYRAGVKHFQEWRRHTQGAAAQVEAPLTADEVCRWLGAAGSAGLLRAGTLRAYLSGLRWHYIRYQDPDDEGRCPLDSAQVKATITGIENTQTTHRLATTQLHQQQDNAPPLLYSTLLCFNYDVTKPRDVMLFAAAALGVAGALRIGELCGDPSRPGRQLTVGQLTFYADASTQRPLLPSPNGAAAAAAGQTTPAPAACTLTLRVTKTRQHASTTKVISAPHAVAGLWRWRQHLARTRAAGPNDPLFITDGGQVLSASILCGDLNRRHVAAGLGPINYTGKSLRRGGASTLALHGLPAADIAALGWAPGSDMWQLYANDPSVQRARAAAINRQMDATAAAAARRH